MNYKLQIFLKIIFLKPLRLFVSLIDLGKELKIFASQKTKALCPVVSLHFFAWCLFDEFLHGIEIVYGDSRESSC